MTTLTVCRTRRDGKPCEHFDAAATTCALVTCCNNPDLPSAPQFRVMASTPRAKCRHPEGDMWRYAEPEPADVLTLIAASPMMDRVLARLAICRPCPIYAGTAKCRVHGDLNNHLHRPEFSCHAGPTPIAAETEAV